jgi:hypothetical protein
VKGNYKSVTGVELTRRVLEVTAMAKMAKKS